MKVGQLFLSFFLIYSKQALGRIKRVHLAAVVGQRTWAASLKTGAKNCRVTHHIALCWFKVR